ncbi:MAG: hypothetical protein RLZ98_924 [Pseudomonadota bacterium]|jgi:hypothetical protein
MTMKPPTREDIMRSPYATALPGDLSHPDSGTRNYFQAIDNMISVFAIRPTDEVLFLTDPLLDRRVVDAISGIANMRGVFPREFMAPTTQVSRCPEEVKGLIEKATFVVSSWFCSVNDPFFQKLRKEKGQRWVKITYFRNLDLLHTPQARFPIDLVGEIIRATARMYPTDRDFDMTFSCPRGSDLSIKFTPDMVKGLHANNRWRGQDKADVEGCYVHFMPSHGPNIYDRNCFNFASNKHGDMQGVIFPQWAVGFERPFEEKIGIEYKDDVVVKVHGKSMDAEVLRDMLVGVDAHLHELGCGFNPKYPRYKAYPAGSNAPGALHFGTDSNTPSEFMARNIPHWEEPHTHQDCVMFDATVKVGDRTLIDNGFLMALRDPQVVEAASKYGNPKELLESFVV